MHRRTSNRVTKAKQSRKVRRGPLAVAQCGGNATAILFPMSFAPLKNRRNENPAGLNPECQLSRRARGGREALLPTRRQRHLDFVPKLSP